MKKIKSRCPKCNAPPKEVGLFFDAGAFYVKCSKCGTYTDTYSRWADSVDAWNKGQV